MIMNYSTDPKPESQKPPTELPRQLRRSDNSQTSKEGVRKINANRTGHFEVFREWSKTVKARPPPRLELSEPTSQPKFQPNPINTG